MFRGSVQPYFFRNLKYPLPENNNCLEKSCTGAFFLILTETQQHKLLKQSHETDANLDAPKFRFANANKPKRERYFHLSEIIFRLVPVHACGGRDDGGVCVQVSQRPGQERKLPAITHARMCMRAPMRVRASVSSLVCLCYSRLLPTRY